MKMAGIIYSFCLQYITPLLYGLARAFIILIVGVVSIFALNSCKRYDLNSWPVSYPNDVEPQITLFIAYAPSQIRAKPLTIILTDNLYTQGMKVSGLTCYHENIIYLDTTSQMWRQARTNLVMHELGHYVLNRRHFNDTTTILDTWESYPVSFMNIGTVKPSDWNLRREDLLEYYLDELFN